MPYSATPETSSDSGLECVVLLARYYCVPADGQQLQHQFARGDELFDPTTILRSFKFLGLKARRVQCTISRLARVALPAIAIRHDGGFWVVAKIAEDKILVHDPLKQRPLSLPLTLFEEAWSGELVLVTRRASMGQQFRKFNLKWFIPEILKYKKLLGEVLLASFFIQLFALVTPLFFQVIIDKVLVHKGLTTLDVLAIGLLVVSLFEIVLGGLRAYLFSHTTNRIDVRLGAKLFRHVLGLPLSYFGARRVGDTVARVRELESIRSFLTGSALTLVIDLLFTIVFLAVMYYYSPTLTYIVLGAIPFYVLLSVVVTPILRARLHEKFNRGAENQAFLVESVSGVETLKSMAVEPQMQRRWEEQLAGYVSAAFRATNLGNIAAQTAGFINKVTTVLILWIGARLVINGDLTVGQLVAFNMLAGRVSQPVLRLVQLWQDFQQAGISVQRLGDILNTRPEPGFNPNRATLPNLDGNIHFDHVFFRYSPERPEVLADVSLAIPAGQVIGVVGKSGSGKSTLAKLVQRMYVPERGRVLVDGVDLALVEPAWLRRQVGVVLQENVLFNRTVRENIALSDPGVPMESVVAVAKMAGAHEFILELAEGYDTLVDEHGSNLSGGQRQRIAIARALLTNPKILILDEATSALDYESERVIQENMQAIAQGRTVLIIAHRLTTVRSAERIIVLDKGRVIEDGTHDELVRRAGQYARLYRHQTGDAVLA